mgnify:FL=1
MLFRSLQGIRGAFQLADDLTFGGAAALLKGGASTLQTVVQPAIDSLNTWIHENKQPIDDMLLNLTESMQQQKVSLASLREGLGKGAEFLDEIDKIADQGGVVDGIADRIIAAIGRLKATPESLGIPSWMPEITYKWAIDRINGLIDSVAGTASEMKTKALSGIDSFVENQTQWIRAKMATIQDAVREGGEVEVLLQQAYDEFAMMARQLAEMIDQFDGVPIDLAGAAAWLTDRAADAEAQTSTEQLKRWTDFLQGEAQGYVDDWRAAHGTEVDQAYMATVPPAEMGAIRSAHGLVSGRLDELMAVAQSRSDEDMDIAEIYGLYEKRQEADAALDTAESNANTKGQAAVETVWGAANNLAEVARSIGL